MLSIPTIRDRVAQGALKLILEPIFEADFQPGSFGYRPKMHTMQWSEFVREFFNARPVSSTWIFDPTSTTCGIISFWRRSLLV